jgi:hypothetical protein
MYRAMLLGVAFSAISFVPAAMASQHSEQFQAVFSGFNEVGALNAQTGAVLSDGSATLVLKLDRSAQTVSYTLKFSGLTSVTQAHIHFGKVHMAGGVMVFFCSNLATAPAGTQACPASAGTVTGTLSAANVLGIAGQNVPAGDFSALVDALQSDTAYANIHTTSFPAGEIRGEIRRSFGFGFHDE